jgi:Ca2+-binding EF-hand superfamily protein
VLSACARSRPETSPTPFLEEPSGSTFERVDRDRDGRIKSETFHRGLSEHYYFRQGLDLDGDGVVLQVELATALFELWDEDDDRSLSKAEWADGMVVWFPDRTAALDFDDWDVNDDGALSVIELGEGAVQSSTFSAYDIDGNGTIETREVSEYLFEQWDENGDSVIDSREWPLP